MMKRTCSLTIIGCVILFTFSGILSADEKQQDTPKTVETEITYSGNPVFEGWYADPEVILYGDEVWIYPTYSDEYDKQLFFDCFSSNDLVHWTKHERILDITFTGVAAQTNR